MRHAFLIALASLTIQAADTVRLDLPIGPEATGTKHVKAVVELSKDAAPPKLIASPSPERWNRLRATVIHVRFSINAKGVPFDIQVEGPSDPETEDDVIAMIREWRFEAALRGEIRVPAQVILEVDGRPRPMKKKPN
jgi:hypothetical protein